MGFELTTTKFRLDSVTNWAIEPWVQLALRANFIQLPQFDLLLSVIFNFDCCLRQSPRLFNWRIVKVITWVYSRKEFSIDPYNHTILKWRRNSIKTISKNLVAWKTCHSSNSLGNNNILSILTIRLNIFHQLNIKIIDCNVAMLKIYLDPNFQWPHKGLICKSIGYE